MALNLFYITNRLDVALIAEKYGVDRIWIDLETLGKAERQKGMNTVKSKPEISDIRAIKPSLTKAELLVRVNPWNAGSASEIDAVIDAGADMIMLPMWRSADEVQKFLSAVDHRVRTTLLLETREAVECIDEVLRLDFDEIHIGLNDLHLSFGMTFMFELLADGTVDRLCAKFRQKGIPYGFGGIARLGQGMLPSEYVIMEHYRLGSTRAILSRSFCDIDKCRDLAEVEERFAGNMKPLRAYESECACASAPAREANRQAVCEFVKKIVEEIKANENQNG